jgi:transposase InsO family protein
VRDLASGRYLLALPCLDVTEATAGAVLAALFLKDGPPLMLMLDNGTAFVAEARRSVLAGHGVTALYLPPRPPTYNGACEAGAAG